MTLEIGDAPTHSVDPRYLSVAVDLGQIAGNRFWNPDATSPETEVPLDGPYDFSRPALRRFAEALSPAALRIGGTESDRLYYDDGTAPDPLPDGYDATLALSRWDDLAHFAADVGMDVMFTLNAGPGPRTPDGSFDPDNAGTLLAHAADRGDPVFAWELGNEPNGFVLQLGFPLTQAQYGHDLADAAALRDRHTPDARLVGASVAFWPIAGEINTWLEGALIASDDALDAVTWHYYPRQGQRCPVQTRYADADTLLDPTHLDEVATWAAYVEDLVDQHEPAAAR